MPDIKDMAIHMRLQIPFHCPSLSFSFAFSDFFFVSLISASVSASHSSLLYLKKEKKSLEPPGPIKSWIDCTQCTWNGSRSFSLNCWVSTNVSPLSMSVLLCNLFSNTTSSLVLLYYGYLFLPLFLYLSARIRNGIWTGKGKSRLLAT